MVYDPASSGPVPSTSWARFWSFFKSHVRLVAEASANGSFFQPLPPSCADTSENVTSTAFALPYGLSASRPFGVPADPDGPPAESDDESLQAKIASTAAAARTGVIRIVISRDRSSKSRSPTAAARKLLSRDRLSSAAHRRTRTEQSAFVQFRHAAGAVARPL